MKIDIFDNKLHIILEEKTLKVEAFKSGCTISVQGNDVLNIIAENKSINTNRLQIR